MRGKDQRQHRGEGEEAQWSEMFRSFLMRLFNRSKDGGKEAGNKFGGPDSWLIVGLGNPGAAYEATRHNVGFLTVDKIAASVGIMIRKAKFRALVGEGVFDGKKLVLLKPQTFMNLSGDAVQLALRYYQTSYDKLIVIYDDVDIDLGAIRLRAFGGPGSHNGMRSIVDCIGDEAKFPRIRIGIGKQPISMELRDYVLKRFAPEEEKLAEIATSAAAAAALDIMRSGVERAMNTHNPKRHE